MTGLTFESGPDYAGEGFSQGLAHGLLTRFNGRDLVEEGLGFGAPVLLWRGWSCFSASAVTQRLGETSLRRTFTIDRRMVWCRGGRPSEALTRFVEFCTWSYMHLPGLQPRLLAAATRVRQRSRWAPRFVPIASPTAVEFSYAWAPDRVAVTCRLVSVLPGAAQLFLLNELGGESFSSSLRGGQMTSPPGGWERLPAGSGIPAFYAPGLGLTFTLAEVTCGRPVQLYWGREVSADLRWAGFELAVRRPPVGFECRYALQFGRAEVR
ncbi:MAG: hypothetical protein ACYC6L_01485 [Anaerolineae bacterium]